MQGVGAWLSQLCLSHFFHQIASVLIQVCLRSCGWKGRQLRRWRRRSRGGQTSYELPLKTIILLSHRSFRAIVFPCQRRALRKGGERQAGPPEFKTRLWQKVNSPDTPFRTMETHFVFFSGCDGNRQGRVSCSHFHSATIIERFV